jgi:hypothetical protein
MDSSLSTTMASPVCRDRSGWQRLLSEPDIYSTKWPPECIEPRYRHMMEAQITIELAGGIAEAIYRCGARRGREALAFAEANCGIERDLERATAVLGDFFRLTGYPVYPMHFAHQTFEMLTTNWRAVEALAAHLIVDRYVEGRDVERIIDRSLFRPSGEHVKAGRRSPS